MKKYNTKSRLLPTGMSLFIFIILFFHLSLAQNNKLVFKNLNTTDGLSNNKVRVITQDSQGFLWIGTTDGLNRYDGYHFTSFRHNPQDSASISDNHIYSMLEDQNGNLWIGTEDGLDYYNSDNGKFTTFKYNSPATVNIQIQYWNTVPEIIKTSDGNLWITTTNRGLIYFDTTQRTFQFPFPDSLMMDDNTSDIYFRIIKDVNADGNGYWIGSWGTGLLYYDVQQKKTKRYRHNPNDPNSLSNDQTRSLYQDPDGTLWVGTLDGLNKFDPANEKFIQYKHDPDNPNSLSNNKIWALYKDPSKNNVLWIGTENGLNRLDTQRNTFTIDQADINNSTALSSPIINEIYKDQWGVMWFGTEGGLNKMEPGRISFRNVNNANNNTNGLNVWAISGSKKNDNNLWVGTYGEGLNKLDRNNNTLSRYRSGPSDPFNSNSDSIRSLYQDPDEAGKVLWVGTNRSGLFRLDLQHKRSKQYKLSTENKHSISSNLVRNIYETRDGMLWIASGYGLNKFDRNQQVFTRYLFQDTTYVSAILSLYNNIADKRKPLASILNVTDFQDITQPFTLNSETKILLIGVGEGFTSLFDFGWLENEQGETICKMDFNQTRHAGGAGKNRLQIWGLTLKPGKYNLHYQTDDSHSWGKWNAPPPQNPNMWGIQAFKIDDKEYNLILQNINKKEKNNSIVNDNATAILEDSYGMLWIGTINSGLSKLDRKSDHFTNYQADAFTPGSLSNNAINALYEDKNGVMWVGTDYGLNKYDPKNDTFTAYTSKDGLPNNTIINILEDKDGNIWLATYNGISRFNPDENKRNGKMTFINYNINDGLQFNSYFRGSCYTSANGELFFGGSNGLTSFYPGKNNPKPPRVLITDFQIFNQPVEPGPRSPLKKQINKTEQIHLDYDQNVFSFEFVALQFSSPEKNQYLYKMDGFDEDWIDGHRRYATYTNLDPGKYTFRVKASNSDGVWNESGTSIHIIISPPWWKTWYAYIAYITIFLGLFWTTRRLELNRRREKENKRILQLENQRKSEELERARQLQLSMLPKQVPQLPNLDIAVYMNPATEVGGDYYDFHLSSGGTLTVAVGDATGHGLNAGMMVTASKSLFETLAESSDILGIMNQSNRVIRQMNLVNLKMAICLLKINGLNLEASGAGMPPLLLYRKGTGQLEEFEFNGMPLGSLDSFPYTNKQIKLQSGDKIILMSDGFPERMNLNSEMLDYPRAYDSIRSAAAKSPQEMVDQLVLKSESWANGRPQDDDVTFVVIEIK